MWIKKRKVIIRPGELNDRTHRCRTCLSQHHPQPVMVTDTCRPKEKWKAETKTRKLRTETSLPCNYSKYPSHLCSVPEQVFQPKFTTFNNSISKWPASTNSLGFFPFSSFLFYSSKVNWLNIWPRYNRPVCLNIFQLQTLFAFNE